MPELLITPVEETERIQSALRTWGFAMGSDRYLGIGLSDDTRSAFHRRFFNDEVLKNDFPDIKPAGRLGFHGSFTVEWDGDQPNINEEDEVIIKAPEGLEGEHRHGKERRYPQTPLLHVSTMRRLLGAFARMIPLEERTSGEEMIDQIQVHGYRTGDKYTNGKVVTRPHRDGRKFAGMWVMSKEGEGADTLLYGSETENEPFLRTNLKAGQFIVLRDELYLHSVTPINGERDALILTYDNQPRSLGARALRAA